MKAREAQESATLRDGMAALRSEYVERPPASLEVVLRGRFQERRRQQLARVWALAALAVAAAIAMAVILLPRHSKQREEAPLVWHSSPLPESVGPEQAARVHEPLERVRTRVGHIAKRRKTVSAQPFAEAEAEFLAVPYAEPLSPSEQVNVYRVEMPGVTLARFGLPIRPDALNSTIAADVVAGSDGVARAVRFVH